MESKKKQKAPEKETEKQEMKEWERKKQSKIQR